MKLLSVWLVVGLAGCVADAPLEVSETTGALVGEDCIVTCEWLEPPGMFVRADSCSGATFCYVPEDFTCTSHCDVAYGTCRQIAGTEPPPYPPPSSTIELINASTAGIRQEQLNNRCPEP
jgi:hypothetical protein